MAMTRIGTAFFMAPEMQHGKYDQKVDCYAWGLMSLNCHKTCGFVNDDQYDIEEIEEGQISKKFVDVIKKSVAKNPNRRPFSSEIVDALKKEDPPKNSTAEDKLIG